MTTLFEISAENVADTTDDRYTPAWVFTAAELVFDLDVAAPVDPSRRTCPARRYLTPVEDGLSQPWDGLVWMNPPYSGSGPWVDRFARHRYGLALMPAYPEVLWMGTLLGCADAVTLISPRYIKASGDPTGKSAFASLLVGCGREAAAAVARVAAADKYAGGAYHVRPGEDT